jgi:hypothetical protein
MLEQGAGRVSQEDREELSDEKVVVGPAHLASKEVVLQPDAGFSLIIVLNNVA